MNTYEILVQHGNASHLKVIEAESVAAAYAKLGSLPIGATTTLLGMRSLEAEKLALAFFP